MNQPCSWAGLSVLLIAGIDGGQRPIVSGMTASRGVPDRVDALLRPRMCRASDMGLLETRALTVCTRPRPSTMSVATTVPLYEGLPLATSSVRAAALATM